MPNGFSEQQTGHDDTLHFNTFPRSHLPSYCTFTHSASLMFTLVFSTVIFVEITCHWNPLAMACAMWYL